MLPKLNLVFYMLAIASTIGFAFLGQWDLAVGFGGATLALSAHLRISGER